MLFQIYDGFLPNLSTTVHSLTQLLGKDHQWKWTEQCEAAFHKAKEMIISEQVLTHYDPSLPLRLACDAYPVGIGAVLSREINDGTERPIAFTSRTLTKTEQKYAQIDKEALSIVWGVKKFHMYLFGPPFTLYTDHRPLTSIFHPRKSIPVVTVARLEQYALFLAGYDYAIQYKNTKVHSNADGLSRPPLVTEAKDEEDVDPVGVFDLMQSDPLPVTVDNVRRETQIDPVLAQVHEMTRKGWPNNHHPVFNPYFVHKDEITLQSGYLMWGIRVIVPPELRPQVLKGIHQGHMGVVKMKALA
ncbi:Transposon Tf2-11 polyprotein [Stylophora pistillata]|uniref:Transposon Tf2-11 polyprotein n=1 Tax=Stylophora pistillata TaxID=50429 RepID=A0A2B4R1T5_STYPI|nr:Transposon Tf2-11 polyprotein [Stylophora pistillata]